MEVVAATMARNDLATHLCAAAELPGAKRTAAYAHVLENILQGEEVREGIATYVRDALLDRVNMVGAGLIVGRQVLQDLCAALHTAHTDRTHPLSDTSLYVAVLRDVLASAHAQAVNLEDELAQVRLLLADALEDQHAYADAAHVLQEITADAGRRLRNDALWLRIYVRIARLLLSADDVAGAELYLKRAASALHADDDTLMHEARVCQALVWDRQRRFGDAAQRFWELCLRSDEAHREAFAAAVASALLASPSAARERLLHVLVGDARAPSLPLYTVLLRAAHKRFLRPDDVHALNSHLAPHHQGTHAARDAAAQHNVCAAARVYATTPLNSLAELVGLEPSACEALVGRMIVQQMLPANTHIDQLANAVCFGAATDVSAHDPRAVAATNALEAAHVAIQRIHTP